MKILITGAMGYVGGRLSEYLLSLYSKEQLFLATTRIDPPVWAQGFPLVRMDLTDFLSVERVIKNTRPDVVIHLAGLSQSECEQDPALADRVNVDGTKTLVQICGANGVSRFLFMSTFQVYGRASGEISETQTVDPRNEYARTKLLAETMVRDGSVRGMVPIIFRLSNGFGYPMDARVAESVLKLAVNSFCRQIVREQKIHVHSDQYRNFISLNNVARAVEFVLAQDPNNFVNPVFNVGGLANFSMGELARKIALVYKNMYQDRDIPITVNKDRSGIGIWSPFIYKYDRLSALGFTIKDDMDLEIKKTIMFFEENKL
ncbi:MAG: NAD(P)-dependent oxidoreductase [Candidatus Omnitrophica bacterium]|nr:NAD(P)-dependent oxidoreductase [Candidatus Omnitrophota bacterium]